MDYVRLEYSEDQQAFHFGYPNEPEETNGYVTIFDKITRVEAQKFIEDVRAAHGGGIMLVEFVFNF